MKRGFYFIGTNQEDNKGNSFFGPTLQEGSYQYYGKLFIHRAIDYKSNPQKWKVSHVESGANIIACIDLQSARLIVKKLQPFSLWDIKTYEALYKAIKQDSAYEKEVEQITAIRYMRA